MFCSNCGKEIEDNSKFCKHCGTGCDSNESSQLKTESNNESENIIKQVCSVIGGLIFLAIIFNIGIFNFGGISSTNEGKSINLEVTESHTCDLGYGARAICGSVKNNTNRNIGYAQVEINLYDKNENIIGSTADNINNLEANSIWKFKAPIIEDNVTTYKIKNVIGY